MQGYCLLQGAHAVLHASYKTSGHVRNVWHSQLWHNRIQATVEQHAEQSCHVDKSLESAMHYTHEIDGKQDYTTVHSPLESIDVFCIWGRLHCASLHTDSSSLCQCNW
jgi:hypothetical protein